MTIGSPEINLEYMRNRTDIESLEEQILAPYAMKSKDSGGRQYPESHHKTRTCYQRDRDRIVHCEAFRKLEYKTQVFNVFEGDYYRTRLTHTIEVAQIARTIGRNLQLNEDLIEAIALAHDLGHPPFGHAGEEALNEIMAEKKLQFNHNKRSYEIVTRYEKRYPDFDGLNLTREVRVGILKHRTSYDIPGLETDLVGEEPTLEAQVVDIADSLAYLNHDIDDGLTSGCISEDELMESRLWSRVWKKLKESSKHPDREMLKYQIVKELIDMQTRDLLEASSANLKKMNFKSSVEVRKHRGTVIGFGREMQQERNDLQNLVFNKFYRHYRVERMTSKAKRIIGDLFKVYKANPNQLPYSIYQRTKHYSTEEVYEIICNYIASMTDRFALDEHKKLFNPYEKV
jgi:dGTPase